MISARRWPGRVSVWARSAVACTLAIGVVSCSTGADVASGSIPHVARVLTLVGERDGVRLTVRLDRDVVAPGGRVRADVRVENRSAHEIRYTDGPCDSGMGLDLSTSMGLAPGRRWPGPLGAFKDAASSRARLPVPAFTTLPGVLQVCATILVLPGNRVLAPGAVLTRTLFWDADVAPGAPARPGAVMVDASFASLPRPVDVHGSMQIAGRDPRTPSPGEILDAALAVPALARVVVASPPSISDPGVSWSDGTWTVDACCASGSTRATIVRVDARTRAVVSVTP